MLSCADLPAPGSFAKQQSLYAFPLPQGQGSASPVLDTIETPC